MQPTAKLLDIGVIGVLFKVIQRCRFDFPEIGLRIKWGRNPVCRIRRRRVWRLGKKRLRE
jgi:hypothetical protein